jgi:hypothetical protein
MNDATQKKEKAMNSKAKNPTKKDLVPATSDNKDRRNLAMENAIEHINAAIDCLAEAPVLDTYTDIPDAIRELEEFLGDGLGDTGFRTLLAFYKAEN